MAYAQTSRPQSPAARVLFRRDERLPPPDVKNGSRPQSESSTLFSVRTVVNRGRSPEVRNMRIFSSTQCDRPPAHGIVMRGNFIAANENEDPWNSRPRPSRRGSQKHEPDTMRDSHRSYGDQKAGDQDILAAHQQPEEDELEVELQSRTAETLKLRAVLDNIKRRMVFVDDLNDDLNFEVFVARFVEEKRSSVITIEALQVALQAEKERAQLLVEKSMQTVEVIQKEKTSVEERLQQEKREIEDRLQQERADIEERLQLREAQMCVLEQRLWEQQQEAKTSETKRDQEVAAAFEERLQQEKTAIEERLHHEKKEAEERLQQEKAEIKERLQQEKAEIEERLQQEKAEIKERLQQEKAEIKERLQQEKAEVEERLQQEKAEVEERSQQRELQVCVLEQRLWELQQAAKTSETIRRQEVAAAVRCDQAVQVKREDEALALQEEVAAGQEREAALRETLAQAETLLLESERIKEHYKAQVPRERAVSPAARCRSISPVRPPPKEGSNNKENVPCSEDIAGTRDPAAAGRSSSGRSRHRQERRGSKPAILRRDFA